MTKVAAGKARKGGFGRVLTRTGNPFVSFLLQSPLHGLLGARFTLLTVTGRKSGRAYTTPVNYVRDGGVLTVISRRGRTWWRNLAVPAPVTVRLKGERRSGTGRVLTLEGAELTDAIRDFYGKMGLHPDDARIKATAAAGVVVHIELDGGQPS